MAERKTEKIKEAQRKYYSTLSKAVILTDRVMDSAEICRLRLIRAVNGNNPEELKMVCEAILGLNRLHNISSDLLHRSVSTDLYFTGE